MKYIEYTINGITETQADIIVAELAEIGFDSFSEFNPNDNSIKCYVQESQENKTAISETTGTNEYTRNEIVQQNWNAIWESNFDPITVGENCYIRATFHEPRPVAHEIIITPKMSFGTGHHPTTHLVVSMMLAEQFEGKQGLDIGSGTGILAILAAQKGAVSVDAIDIDEWAYENCIENIHLNKVENIVRPILGDATSITKKYDFILANINRNILLRDMQNYVTALNNSEFLIVSGILEMDVDAITAKATELGLLPEKNVSKDGWAAIKFVRSTK